MSEKKEKEMKNLGKKRKKPTLSYAIFLLCFIPYLLLLQASIFGVDFGFFGESSTYYGWDAVNIEMLVLVVIPVLPVAAIYQVIFLLVTWKRRSSLQRIINCVLIFSIAGALFLSCIIWSARSENYAESVYQEEKQIIEAYLREAFGEEYAAEMEVLKPSKWSVNYEVSPLYQVKTPIMESTFPVCMDEARERVETCCFCETYTKNFDLQTILAQKLAEKYDVPENIEIDVIIHSFPYQKAFEQDMDNLLDSCDFEFTCVYLNTGHYDQKETIEEIRRFYNGYGQELLNHRKPECLFFYVMENDNIYARIKAEPSGGDPASCQLQFNGYKDGEGVSTIKDEILDITL